MSEPYSSSLLAEWDTPQKTAFMRSVYDEHLAWAQRGKGRFTGALPEKELLEIEGGEKARRDAAGMCKKLLAKVREELKAAQDSRLSEAVLVTSIGVQSGYRSSQEQFDRWRSLFPKYYRLTQSDRDAAPGGEHGGAAVHILVRFYRSRYGVPGYSLHNSGLAIDFNTQQGGATLAANKDQVTPWKQAWFFKWLSANAADFFFYQNDRIVEPWHWEFRGPGHTISRPSTDGEATAMRCTFEHGDDYPQGGTVRA